MSGYVPHHELSNLRSILDFFRKHPLCTGDFFAGEEFVDEDYSVVITYAMLRTT